MITAELGDGTKSTLALKFESLAIRVRFQRTLGAFLTGLGLAVVFVLIPILHFVLVPGALIGAIVMSIRRYRQEVYIPEQEWICPRCQGSTQFQDTYLVPNRIETKICGRCYCRQQIRFESC